MFPKLRDHQTGICNNVRFWVDFVVILQQQGAQFLMEIGRVRGVVRSKIRHPMLVAVILWSIAHLLVNGDLPSVLLFGGLGLWALGEMALINITEGACKRPEPGKWINDLKILAVASVIYGVVVGIHYGLDHPVIALLW